MPDDTKEITKEFLEDRFFPIANIPKMNQPMKPAESSAVIKKIIQGAVQGAYQKKLPSKYDIQNGYASPMPNEQIEFVTHLIESLQPQDAIEAALASQFSISYIRGLKAAQGDYNTPAAWDLFRFGHEVLETLIRFRSKGAQQIQVNYNHNQGQINNIKVVESKNKQETIEVKNEM